MAKIQRTDSRGGRRQGVLHCAPDGSILSVDRDLASMLGYRTWKEVTRSVLSILEFYAEPADRRRLAGRLDSGLPGDEARWLRADGTSIWVRTRVREVEDWDAGERVLEVDVEEVTERRHVEEQLRRLQRMEAVGSLAGGMAHDFNDQLTTILSHLDLLDALLVSHSEIREAALQEVEQIRSAATRGARMVERLLGFTRSERIEPRRVELDELAVPLGRLVTRLLPAGMELRMVNVERIEVLADPGAVEEMVLALATNARDAMGDGGVLTLESHLVTLTAEDCARRGWGRPGTYGCLAISDTGPGIPAPILDREFEPVDGGRHGGGAGLGLPLVYGLMKQHRGFLDLMSRPGEGATARLLFPLASPAAESRGSSDGNAARLGGRAVLLVDDDPQVRRVTARVLAGRGHIVLEARNGEEALRMCAARPDVGLVLTDLVMPGMGGIELADRLEASDSTARVVFTSGYSPADLAHREALPDAALLLNKPWTVDALMEIVREGLEPGSTEREQAGDAL